MSELKRLLINYSNDTNTTNYKRVESFILNNTSLTCKKKIKKIIVLSLLQMTEF